MSGKRGIASALKTGAAIFGGAAATVAVAGEIAAWRRDRASKPAPKDVVDITSERAQEIVSQATYGTGIVLDPDQRRPAPGPKDTYAYHVIKRGFDVAFSSCAVVGCAVPVVVICWLIYLDEPGFPLYRQRRVGRYGLPVEIYKLRTMVPDADRVERHLTPGQVEQWRAEHKVDDDPRITRIGRWLRETSLDEIPQFLSVLTGEMSVVGPRPVEPDELSAYGKGVVEFLSVTPGITGWWQVTSRNDATYTDGQRQALELHYVRNRGVGLDLRVIAGTFRAMFGKKRTGR